MKKFLAKKRKGFDGIIVTIVLILFVVIALVLINTTILPKVKSSINKAGNEIESINNWN